MITAYVLINAHIGKEKDVPSQLRNVDEVKKLLETTGKFDFVARWNLHLIVHCKMW